MRKYARKYAADNLMMLREQYPEIYKLVRNRSGRQNRFAPETSRNGQPNLLVSLPEGGNFHLYSKYDPSLEAARWVQSLDGIILQSNDVLMAGFGLGYHLAAFLEAFPEKRVYLYEPSLELFLAAIETIDLRPIMENRQVVMFAVGEEDVVIKELLIRMYKTMMSVFSFTVLPFYRRLNPDLEGQIARLAKEQATGYSVDINTISYHAADWIENMMINLERSLRTPSFIPLKGVCVGLPAVIVGSGPSLGEEVEWLRQLRNHAFIIAAGTGAKALLHHGVEPHLIVSMDPGEPNYLAFRDLEISHIPFLYITTIKHTVIRDDRSPYLMHGYFDIDCISHYLLELQPEDGVLSSSSTVTGTSIQIAAYLGCTEMVFIGQDFSYPGNQVYSGGVDHVDDLSMAQWIKNAGLTIENVNGEVNPTNLSMLHLKRDVEEVISTFPHVSFYNASRIGAVIQHTTPKTLEQMLKEYVGQTKDPDWFKTKMRELLTPPPPERREKALKKATLMMEELREMEVGMERLREHLERKEKPNPEWFVRFEVLWSAMIEHSLYQRVFSFFLVKERTYTERYWGEMVKETDLRLKKQILLDCIRPTAGGLAKLIPLMSNHLNHLREKLARN